MAVAYFPSFDSDLEQAEAIEIGFLKLDGGQVTLRLLVDSGFTGHSSFVLPEALGDIAQAIAPASRAAGALQGLQKRVVVTCRIGPLSLQHSAIAILADISPLSLPAGIQGLAGLRFLRHFRRWGAERTKEGWRFLLETDATWHDAPA